MKKTLLLAVLSSVIIPSAFADTVNIENPDGLNIKLTYDGTEISSTDTRFYNAFHPATPAEIKVVANEAGFEKKLINSRVSGSGIGCNYSLIISKNYGWKLQSLGEKCSLSEDNYNPPQPGVYVIVNESNSKVYPSFDIGWGLAADSVKGWLAPNSSRMYDEHTTFWQHQQIVFGTNIKVGLFDADLNDYKNCSTELRPISGGATFTYHANKTCTIK